MNAEQRAMFAALEPLASDALADSLEEDGDTSGARCMRERARFGRLFFEIMDKCIPRFALDVTHIDHIHDVTIYTIRTAKRITMEFVRPISRDDVLVRTFHVKPLHAATVAIDVRGMFKMAPDLWTAGLHQRIRDKIDDMFRFVIRESEAVAAARLHDNRPWHHVKEAAKRKAWIT